MFNLLFWLTSGVIFLKNAHCLHLPSSYSETDITQVIQNIIDKSMYKTTGVNADCREQLGWFLKNLNSSEDGIWALKMIDASAKVPAGILTNNKAWMGNFDECLAIDEVPEIDIKPKYCIANLNGTVTDDTLKLQNLNKKYNKISNDKDNSIEMQNALLPSFGLCVPHKCNIEDIRQVLKILDPTKTYAITCQTKDDLHQPLDTGAIITIGYFGFFILLMTVSTIYDLRRDQNVKPHQLLIAFSVYTNSKRLFKTTKNSRELSCLNGLRFLSMVWVIIGHVVSVIVVGPMVNVDDMIAYMKTTKSLVFVNGIFSVDTFLVVTGFLVVYSFMKAMQQGHKFNIIVFYLHRYLRLTPPLIPIILCSIFLIKYLGSGPFYPQTVQYSEACQKYWWSTLLYIETYVNVHQMCVSQTWYLNVDWQLYLIAPVFLLFLPKRPLIGIFLMICGALGAMVASFIVTWENELPALQSNLNNGVSTGFTEIYYMKTHTRAANWFIGGILGYFLGKMKSQPNLGFQTFPKWLVGLNWIIALTTLSVCIFAGLDDLNNEDYHAYSNALFNTLARPAWGLCIDWIILACTFGYGGIINTILSLPIFQILNRFTYSMYLLHLTILYLMVFSAKQPAYFSIYNAAYSFWGIFALCFGLSIFWVLAFESPVPVIEKYLLGKRNTRTESKVDTKSTIPESTRTEP